MKGKTMTPATKAKASAIFNGMGTWDREGSNIAYLLAMLTSANKEEREKAKGVVRGYVAAAERNRIKAENAAVLADFANRHEP